jgi:hypothetical protein
MRNLTFVFLFFSTSILCQSKDKKLVTIDYLNFTDTLAQVGNYFYKNDTIIFGISTYSTCGVFYTTTRGYHVFSFGNAIATYYLENKHIKLMYGTELDYKVIYVKLGKISYLEFMKENTEKGKLKSIQNLRINNKKPKIYCGVKPKKKYSFRYKLINRCN